MWGYVLPLSVHIHTARVRPILPGEDPPVLQGVQQRHEQRRQGHRRTIFHAVLIDIRTELENFPRLLPLNKGWVRNSSKSFPRELPRTTKSR